jgi:radical SAM protein with 4Fe4S-binding SPASM domain
MCGASDQSFGNILETPLREIWASEPLREYRSLQWLPESCISCSFLKNCLAGCRYSDPATNSYAYGPDFYLRQGQ